MGQRTLTVCIIMMLMWGGASDGKSSESVGDSSDDEDDSVDLDEYEDDPAETGSALDTTGIIDSEEGFQDKGELKDEKPTYRWRKKRWISLEISLSK